MICIPVGQRRGSNVASGSLFEKFRLFILRRGGRIDFVAPPSQITADMLSRRASSLHRPRSQSEWPEFFNRLQRNFFHGRRV
jgi:hypothetical protein